MIQRGSRFGFLLKSQEALGIKRNQLGNDFDCYVAVQAHIARTVHRARVARAKRREYLVLTDFCCLGREASRRIIDLDTYAIMAAEDGLRVSTGKLQCFAENLPLMRVRSRFGVSAPLAGTAPVVLNRSSQDRAFDGKALDPYLSAFVRPPAAHPRPRDRAAFPQDSG